ncbi:hypothetical protein HYV88_01225 [Candidatus Woesearchaeota archaeon]|nr:hypothetical protein [Candidatus Woesearchaeota archaeon]
MVYLLIIANLAVILLFVLGAIIYRHYIVGVDKLVRKLKESGKGFGEILEIANEKKLNPREVKLYYLLYFFQDFQNMGYDLESIKESALNSGWPRDMVELVYKKLRNI